ncbi:DUF2188 domain-containing protein [Pseudanabaena sp. FACHB-2040]|uniref:DUF2188 domain-containing protein n=1 Tax=Pseudanabaena sp. FACHB-2040 TaxID=2692859 RepID=UPI0016832765|nr:DUF2188 domain-containing protein [Pseudanabaena sp. FACHB-2040]MBD2258215.1 DUF2188 domain-containing protein [Pseudanabaena sp. FACHB-2040]
MPWSDKDYPASMKNLADEVRHKAIEIANALLGEGYREGQAIAIATAQAEKWAKRRGKPIRQTGAAGSAGHAIAKGDPQADHAIHVIPDPQGDGWIARRDEQRIAHGQQKGDVLHKAREKAKTQQVELYVHDETGQVVDEEDYSA